MKWFSNCKSIEDVKATYRKLCFKYHPDIAGSDAESTMKEINNEYEQAFKKFKNIHANANGETAENNSTANETPEMFKDIINGLIHCDGVQIDIVGAWVWLTGNTFEYREIIKGLGFKWANKKKAWYWHTDEYKCRRSKMTLDEIKEKYGCQNIETIRQPQLA